MTYKIERLGHLGDGIAAGPVFVDRVLPNETVDGVVEDGRITSPKIIEPSEHRVKSGCPAYNRCGGCGLQHASDGFVANWKTDVVTNALAARDIQAHIRQIHTSPPNARRRAKLTGRRLKKSAVVGFHQRKANAVTDIVGCTVLSPAIMAILPVLEDITARHGSRRGSVEFWVLDTETGLDVAIDGVDIQDPTHLQNLASLAQDANIIRLSIGDETVFQSRAPQLTFGHIGVCPPPKAFVQATTQGERAIQSGVSEALNGAAGPIVDLFSGCGTIGAALAHKHPVHAVEGEAPLLDALLKGAQQAQGQKQVTIEKRDLFRRPIDETDLNVFGAAVLDPPRAGAEAQIDMVAKSALNTVAMVSCNPVTFARDAATLIAAGFNISFVDVIDQFRWSHHVELVAAFRR